MKQIEELFAKRDKSVSKKDIQLFLSTQLEEIDASSSSGYLELEKLESGVLFIYPQQESDTKKVFIKEKYFYKNRGSGEAFLIYYLVKVGKNWKVYKIAY